MTKEVSSGPLSTILTMGCLRPISKFTMLISLLNNSNPIMHTHTIHTLHNILSKLPPLKWSGGIWKGTSTTPSWWVYPTTAVTATATMMNLRWLTSSTIISTFSTTSLSITRAVSMNQKWHQLSEKTRDHSNWPRNKSARRTSMVIQICKQELRVSTLTDTQRQLPI